MDEISRNTTEVIMQVHNLFRSRISAITAAKDMVMIIWCMKGAQFKV